MVERLGEKVGCEYVQTVDVDERGDVNVPTFSQASVGARNVEIELV
jgi:hypothetical protein